MSKNDMLQIGSQDRIKMCTDPISWESVCYENKIVMDHKSRVHKALIHIEETLPIRENDLKKELARSMPDMARVHRLQAAIANMKETLARKNGR